MTGATRIVAVVNEKGGVGKTTTTMSLAAVAADTERVAIVDADPQESSSIWWWQRLSDATGGEPPFRAASVLRADDMSRLREIVTAGGYDVVFVDTPGSLENRELLKIIAAQSDYMILPSEPAPLSFPSLGNTIKEIAIPAGVPYRVLINKMDSSRKTVVDEIFAQLDAMGMPHFNTAIRRYVAHERAPQEGLVVTSYPKGRETRNAIDDYRLVAQELFSEWSRLVARHGLRAKAGVAR